MLYGALVLVARDAARHFVFVRGKIRATWRFVASARLALATAEVVRTSRVRRRLGRSFISAIPFALHHSAKRSKWRDRVVAFAPGPEGSETRVEMDRHWTRPI